MAEPKRKAPATGEKSKPASKKKHQEELLDEALEESFPASDAIAMIEPAPDGEDGERENK
jgi:hypothetical protein